MAKDEADGSMSDESKGFLEDVKKGKPRKFAMICKGASVVSLVVYKKGAVEKRKKEAKESGKGQFYFGTVAGKGVDIRFLLARSDGFESAPVKTTVLKSYLAESADMKCKPVFEIVDEPQLVLDEDDPLAARFLQLQSAAQAACGQHPDRAADINALCREISGLLDQDPPDQATVKLDELETLLASLATAAPQAAPASDSSVAADPNAAHVTQQTKLAAALKKLKPLIDNVIQADPTRKSELFQSLAQIAGEIKQGQLEDAKSNIVTLSKLVQGLLAQSATTAPADTVGGEPSAAMAGQQTKLAEGLKKLKPLIDKAIEADPNRKNELFQSMAQIAGEIKQGKLEDAKSNIVALGRLVQGLLAQTGTATATESAQLQSNFEAAKNRIEPQLNAARQANPEKSNALLNLWNYAMDQAEAGNLTSANTALGKLEAAIGKILAEPASDAKDGVFVAMQAARLQWDQTRKNVANELQKLETAILERCRQINADPEEEFEIDEDELTDRVKQVYTIMDKLDTRLIDKLDEALNAEAKELRQQKQLEAVGIIKEYQSVVNSDPLVAEIDNSGFMNTSIKTTFVDVLNDLASRL